MKLFTRPGASSMHIHTLLREIGATFDFEVVNVTKKLRADGSDYRLVAPQGLVPFLVLDYGQALTENMVVAQYVCDLAGREDLMPAPKTLARYRVMQWQSYVPPSCTRVSAPSSGRSTMRPRRSCASA